MDNEKRKIGIALSGGGIRATIFHLGVIKWMAENDMLEDIIRISSVSGASLCVGLIYSHNQHAWPSSEEYLNQVFPKVKNTILTKDIQLFSLIKLILSPWWWYKKVNLVAKVMQKKWDISGSIADLEKNPIWFINCTTFETGKRFIFSQEKMGDYKVGYVKNPDFSLADAIAASSGFPILIGPYKIRTDSYKWTKATRWEWDSQKDKFLHLWDGGVYDNLGLESVYKIDNCGTLSEDIDYLIVSNASGSIDYENRKNGLSGRNLKRLLEIAMDQVGALRARNVMDYIKRTRNGIYIKIGNCAKTIVEASYLAEDEKEKLIAQCMSDVDAKKARDYPTTLRKPSVADFNLILQHGYEVAKCTYNCFVKK